MSVHRRPAFTVKWNRTCHICDCPLDPYVCFILETDVYFLRDITNFFIENPIYLSRNKRYLKVRDGKAYNVCASCYRQKGWPATTGMLREIGKTRKASNWKLNAYSKDTILFWFKYLRLYMDGDDIKTEYTYIDDELFLDISIYIII
jgi:hypothetical protein